MDKDKELEELQAEIERRSGEGRTASAEELAEDAKRRHLEAQGAKVDMSGKPSLSHTADHGALDTALTDALRHLPVEPHDDPEDGATEWDDLANPHALRMVLLAEETREPLFCFRARDFFSIQVIAYYADLVERYGPDDASFHRKIVDALGEFKDWQKANTSLVRYPD